MGALFFARISHSIGLLFHMGTHSGRSRHSIDLLSRGHSFWLKQALNRFTLSHGHFFGLMQALYCFTLSHGHLALCYFSPHPHSLTLYNLTSNIQTHSQHPLTHKHILAFKHLLSLDICFTLFCTI